MSMMQRERVTGDIFVFFSDLYVQVTAGVIVTEAGIVLIDTLLYPEETKQIRRFIDERLQRPVRYVINTHHHADHTTGTCFFPEADVIAHRRCREILDTRGRKSLAHTRRTSPDMADVELVLPEIVFDDTLTLHTGDKTLHLEHMPGHSADCISVWVEEDNVLFAADTIMPVPYFVDGSYDDFLNTLRRLEGREYEAIVQGHGDIILRGEVASRLQEDINYLEKLQITVDDALASADDSDSMNQALTSIDKGACGKSHVLFNGVADQLHHQNVLALAKQRRNTTTLSTNNRSS
jgi:glyoxylase-like metal-dependent hydrolase (beta-lactamase superfamily II)